MEKLEDYLVSDTVLGNPGNDKSFYIPIRGSNSRIECFNYDRVKVYHFPKEDKHLYTITSKYDDAYTLERWGEIIDHQGGREVVTNEELEERGYFGKSLISNLVMEK